VINGAAARGAGRGVMPEGLTPHELRDLTLSLLDAAKAEDAVTIDLVGKSPMADYMVIATGRSDRHVGAIAEQVLAGLKEAGLSGLHTEGLAQCDWVLVDALDVIVHVFRAEVRAFYNLEKMWSPAAPGELRAS
jgi:ribosome-associated protein